jgi:hypothetical protein
MSVLSGPIIGHHGKIYTRIELAAFLLKWCVIAYALTGRGARLQPDRHLRSGRRVSARCAQAKRAVPKLAGRLLKRHSNGRVEE